MQPNKNQATEKIDRQGVGLINIAEDFSSDEDEELESEEQKQKELDGE